MLSQRSSDVWCIAAGLPGVSNIRTELLPPYGETDVLSLDALIGCCSYPCVQEGCEIQDLERRRAQALVAPM